MGLYELSFSGNRTVLPLGDILRKWRPGSGGDDWTWGDEYFDLIDQEYTQGFLRMISNFGMEMFCKDEPILLGNDERVWNGHHRIIIATVLGLEELEVDIIP